jgi:hypothetical protein
MGSSDGAQLRRSAEACEGRKLAHVDFVRAPCFGIGDIGEPFELGRDIGEVAVLSRCQGTFSNRHQVLRHARRPCFADRPTRPFLT